MGKVGERLVYFVRLVHGFLYTLCTTSPPIQSPFLFPFFVSPFAFYFQFSEFLVFALLCSTTPTYDSEDGGQ